MIESRQSYSKESRVQFFWPTLYNVLKLLTSVNLPSLKCSLVLGNRYKLLCHQSYSPDSLQRYF